MARAFATRQWAAMAVVVLVSAACAVFAPRVLPFVDVAENWTSDLRVAALSPPMAQSEDIVLVTVTEDTLAGLAYRSPLDRAFLADVVEALVRRDVRAVVLDVLFDQPTEPEKDRRLHRVLQNLNVPLVVATADASVGLTPAQDAYLKAYTQGLDTGYANVAKDPRDGVARWSYPGRETQGTFVPGLAGAAARALGFDAPRAAIRLDYRARPAPDTPPFKTYPAHVVNVLPVDWFAGKVVLIGADLPLDDRHRTPFAALSGSGGTRPGVAIHAHALSQIMEGRTFPAPSWAGEWALVLVMTGLGMVLARLDLGVVAKGGMTLFVVAGFAVIAAWIWRQGGMMLPFIPPVLGLGLSFAGGVTYFGRRERELRKFIREAFSRYLSPKLVERLIEDPDQLKVGGERRELTYVFTDIAGFTTLTEHSDPTALVPMLNSYIDGMCQTAMAHGATLDKVIGDATVSFFNAPVDQDDHPARAVACALALDAFARDFAARQRERGMDMGVTRIGVHTGTATIGNFGGDAFFDYTAFGDMVNTAARLESVNKHLGTRICVSGATAKRAGDVVFRPVGVLVLKGKSEGLEVFEPLEEDRRDSPAMRAYRQAYDLLCAEDPAARDAFAAVLDLDPSDPLAQFHLQRLERGEKGAMIVMKEK